MTREVAMADRVQLMGSEAEVAAAEMAGRRTKTEADSIAVAVVDQMTEVEVGGSEEVGLVVGDSKAVAMEMEVEGSEEVGLVGGDSKVVVMEMEVEGSEEVGLVVGDSKAVVMEMEVEGSEEVGLVVGDSKAVD